MRKPMFLRAAAALACTLAAALPTLAATPLPPEVEAALARANVPPEHLVVLVQEVGQPLPRLSWQPHQPVNAASLQKLLTTAAALDLLGPAWQWRTPVWVEGERRGSVLKGSLYIKGSGDPKLVVERMWQLLRRVQQLGIRRIEGDIVLDRSAFALPPHDAAAFDNEPHRPSNAGPDALLVNYRAVTYGFTPVPGRQVAAISADVPLDGVRTDDTVPLIKGACDDWRGELRADFTRPDRVRFAGGYPASCGTREWSVAPADPQRFTERAIAGLWRELGGRLDGQVREGTAPASAPTLEFSSPPLAEVVRDINKFSNNVMAQQLFLTLGLTQRGVGSPETGQAVMRQWLIDRFGDHAAGTVLDNGSGLSRDARVTAQLLARVLQASWMGPSMPELMSSLPVSGVDGTMRRTRNANAGRAHLKTGSLRDVTGIAGYVLGASGRRHVLVAVINHPNAGAARPALEALAQWTGGL
ncbi:MAG: D-alanyl-D-alanine carboxypeptidase/D-alanyl-D-alanine-endopeptidase [Rhizobacter sp.]